MPQLKIYKYFSTSKSFISIIRLAMITLYYHSMWQILILVKLVKGKCVIFKNPIHLPWRWNFVFKLKWEVLRYALSKTKKYSPKSVHVCRHNRITHTHKDTIELEPIFKLVQSRITFPNLKLYEFSTIIVHWLSLILCIGLKHI